MTASPTFTISVGLESPELTVDQCRANALWLAAQCFPAGHTITEATGRWESPQRGLIDEPTLVVTVIGDVRQAALQFASSYKQICSQDSVLVQVTHPETLWV